MTEKNNRIDSLICIKCQNTLALVNGQYRCDTCKAEYKVNKGIPIFLPDVIKDSTLCEIKSWNNKKRKIMTVPPWQAVLIHANDMREYLDAIESIRFSGKVLEIGAGYGWASLIVKSRFPETEVYITDVALSALIKSQEMEKMFGVQADKRMVVDIQSTPFPDKYFDIVLGCSVLHHIPDLTKGLSEIYRILKPGGTYVGYGEPMAARYLHRATVIIGAVPPERTDWGTQEKVLSNKEWKHTFKAAGFKSVDIRIAKDPRYKADRKIAYLYYLLISKFPNTIISRFLGSGINLIAQKDS